MSLPSQPWLRVALLATALVFLGDVAYLYGLRFFSWIESDASVTVLLADKALQAGLPVVRDWYYVSGDVWVLAPHLFALLPVAIFGVGPATLLISVALGFAVELLLYVKLYARLCGERWVGVFAAMVTLMAWSEAHVAFVYIQLAYGFLTLLYVLSFGMFAVLGANAPARPWRWAAAGFFVALLVVQNPTRGLVFVVAPLLAGCAWPWQGFDRRRRITVAVTAIAGWMLAVLIYKGLLQHAVTWSVPRGHIDFVVRNAAGIADNFEMLGRGLLMLCGGDEQPSLRAIPGAMVMAGAVALVGREVLRSRAFTMMRFFGVVVMAQLGVLLVPLLIGNLLISPSSVRYLMPALLAVFGFAATLAVRTLGEPGAALGRKLASGWLVLVPLAALLATPNARPPVPEKYGWPDAEELGKVGDELARRQLTHGFANILNTNILNLESRGRSKTCSVFFAHLMLPQRWLVDTSCYTASALPDRFYVVTDHDKRDAAALRATLPEPLERFSVGDTYEIVVFRTAAVPLEWLELPLAEGNEATFPIRISATSPVMLRANIALEAGKLVATGEQGYALYGPYMKLPKGTYEVSWIGSGIDTPGVVTFLVDADVGKAELARIAVPAAELGRGPHTELKRLSFKLDRMREAVEFPVFSAGGARVQIEAVVVEKR